MHPIINEFIKTSERLTSILEKFADENNYLESVFLQLGRAFYFEHNDQKLYIELDKAIVHGHRDPSVYMLFIIFSTAFAGKHDQTERASAIMSIAYSIPQDKLHPLIQSFLAVTIAQLKADEGKWQEADNLFKESIANIDKNQPRSAVIILNIALALSLQGRLKELNKECLDILTADKNEIRKSSKAFANLMNCLFTGNLKDTNLIEEYKKYFQDRPNYKQGPINLLQILAGDFDEKNYSDEFYRLYANICFCLKSGDIQKAISGYKKLQIGKWQKEISLEFERYIPLNIELSLKNKKLARSLFQEMKRKSCPLYLDDFFLARIQLLEMNPEGAKETFHRLMENIKKYDAMNRLTFELQFANEMKLADILFLMNGIKENEVGKTITQKPQPIVIDNKFHGIELLIGDSPEILKIKKLVKKFASLKDLVLITGETGTGKELISRAIHEEGPNSKEPFLAINCGALTESLLQSELFGYVAGAFTGAQKERKGIFEAAGKGTVFLDEFGDISQKMQVSLLRVLESNEIRLIGATNTRKIKCKIVIATNIDLQKAVNEKRFREDLYFRLIRFEIKLTPLRDRLSDISKLIDHFLMNNYTLGESPKIISKDLLEVLKTYPWPGNIRELKNTIERLKILHSEKEIINIEDFDFSQLQDSSSLLAIQKTELADKKPTLIETSNQKQKVKVDRILEIVLKGSKVEQRHEFIRGLFLKYSKLTKRQIMEIASIGPVTATNDLKSLCKLGVIEKRTPTKSAKSNFFILVDPQKLSKE